MNLHTVTLDNGMRAVVQNRSSSPEKTALSGFAAELRQTAQAASMAASGSPELKAAYERLSAPSKAVLNRIKAGETNVSKDEWTALRRELRDAGLISQDEFFRSDPNIAILGYTDSSGKLVLYPFSSVAEPCGTAQSHDGVWTGSLQPFVEWTGDPLQFIDQWLEAIRSWRDDADRLCQPDGTKYDTSHLTRQADAHEKVVGLVKELLELC